MKPQKFKLKVEGFNQLRLLSELTKAGIKMTDIERKKTSETVFTIAKKDSSKTFAILEKMCYNYTVIERTDLKTLMLSAAARAGLLAGLLIFSAVLTLFYGFIWRIEIKGNEKVDELLIIRALKDSGIAIGKPKKNLDKNAVRGIVNSIDGVLESSVKIGGALIEIDIIETTDFAPVPPSSDIDIVSLYDATVTRMITTSGTALVARGQRVKKGEPLIGAYITDSEGNAVPALAKGSVYGEVSFIKTTEFFSKTTLIARTGKKYSATDLYLMGLNIKGKHKHGFESFETETETSYVFDGMFVPLKMTRTVYYETSEQIVERDPETTAEELKRNMIEELIIKAGGAEIATSHFLAKADENIYRLTVYVQAEMLISAV